MKHFLFVFLTVVILIPFTISAQVKSVIVEKYYISDANDATDTTDGRSLTEGSVTYRVYIEIQPGSKLHKIYGDNNHLLKISSTTDFFNNIDRTTAYFGYLMNKSWFPSNPTIALDSWLTLGQATKTQFGILKSMDADGSIIGGIKNSGGSSSIPGGILVNADSAAGIPLTTSDGLITSSILAGQWSDLGFNDGLGTDTTIFGPVAIGSQFISNNAYLQQNSGVVGPPTDSNKVLIAQLTTTGQLSFELNIELIEPNGASMKFVNYVAKSSSVDSATAKLCPYLTYPLSCGCKDPHYLEYNASYGCDDNGSCKTPVIFGCMDPMSCNYDPHANFNIPALCCYPGYCNDRDISVVCPALGNATGIMAIYPNPAQDQMTMKALADGTREMKYAIYNSFGRLVKEKHIETASGEFSELVNLSDLGTGIYMLRLSVGETVDEKIFVKN